MKTNTRRLPKLSIILEFRLPDSHYIRYLERGWKKVWRKHLINQSINQRTDMQRSGFPINFVEGIYSLHFYSTEEN